MKTSLGTTVVLGAMLLGVSPATARAEEVCRIAIPFPFVVHGQTLPSGQYDVRTDDGDPGIVMINGIGNTRAHAMASTIPEYGHAPSRNKPALTFVRDGDQYQLTTVWEGRDYGRDVITH
jgi:hypothetical protein